MLEDFVADGKRNRRALRTMAAVCAATAITFGGALAAPGAQAQSGDMIEACLGADGRAAAASASLAGLRSAQRAGGDRDVAIAAGRLALDVANDGRFRAANCLFEESALAATRARDRDTLARSRFNQALVAARVTQASDVSGNWFQATRGGASLGDQTPSGLDDMLNAIKQDWRPQTPEQIVDLALEAARQADVAGLSSLGSDARVLAVNEAGTVLSAEDVRALLDEAAVAASDAGDPGAQLRIAEAAIEWAAADSGDGAGLVQLAYIQLTDVINQAASERLDVLATGLLGRLYGLRGRSDEALALTGEAVIGAARLNDTQAELEFLIQLGAVSEASGEVQAALAHYDRARDIVELVRPALVERPIEAGEPTLRAIMAPALLARVDLMLRLDGDDPDTLREVRETLELMKLLDLETLFAELCIRIGAGEIVALDTLGEDVAVIYPVLLPDRTELVVATRGAIIRHTAAAPGPRVDSLAVAFRQSLQLAETDAHRGLGQSLYDAIIAPVHDTLEDAAIETLVFAPDGNLRSVPLAALNNEGRYLIEDFAVATALGLSLVDPQAFDAQSVRGVIAGVSEARSGLSALPAVLAEVDAVSASVPNAAVLVDDGFTAQSLEAALSAGDINLVHIATHAQFSPVAEESFLLAHDRRLRLREVEALIDRAQGNRARPIDLLTLSACETAVGDDRAVLGLAGAAYLAGARSVVGSLWQIPDQSTSVLVASFYDRLIGENASKADALRAAQLSLLSEPSTAHPYHWSAFIVLGNWL